MKVNNSETREPDTNTATEREKTIDDLHEKLERTNELLEQLVEAERI